jgi:hypothetical protein
MRRLSTALIATTVALVTCGGAAATLASIATAAFDREGLANIAPAAQLQAALEAAGVPTPHAGSSECRTTGRTRRTTSRSRS